MWPEGLHMHTQEAHLQSVIQTDLLAAPDSTTEASQCSQLLSGPPLNSCSLNSEFFLKPEVVKRPQTPAGRGRVHLFLSRAAQSRVEPLSPMCDPQVSAGPGHLSLSGQCAMFGL